MDRTAPAPRRSREVVMGKRKPINWKPKLSQEAIDNLRKQKLKRKGRSRGSP